MAGFIRSVACNLVNESDSELRLVHEELLWGSYDVPPPQVIAPGETGSWRSSTSGFMTGTEGSARYEIGGEGGSFEVYWNNPFIGDNQLTQSCEGCPRYVHVSPEGTDPETGDVLDEAGLEGNDDISVTYRFITTPGAGVSGDAGGGEEHEWPPSNRDPKPVKTSGNEAVLVRDSDARHRKLVFFGLNSPQADKEAARLRRDAPPIVPQPGRMPAVRTVTPADMEAMRPLCSAAEPLAAWIATLKLDSEATAAVEALLATMKTQRPRPELLSFIAVLAEVEIELRLIEAIGDTSPDGESPPMKRLIISGHHWGYKSPGHGFIWGSWGHSCGVASPTNNRFTPPSQGNDLSRLSKIFPKAFAQVEDVMLAACNTGHHAGSGNPALQFVDQLVAVFPNVQTVWAYAATAPSKAGGVEEIAAWERISRVPNAKDTLVEEAHYRRYEMPNFDRHGRPVKGGGRPVVWVRNGDTLEPAEGGALKAHRAAS